MVAGVLTVEVPSPARISPRSIGLPPTSAVGLPSRSLLPVLPVALSSSFLMLSASPSRYPSMSIPMAPRSATRMSSSRSSATISTSVPVSLSMSLTSPSPSTSKLPRMATLAPTRASPGSSPSRSSSKRRHSCRRRFNFSCWHSLAQCWGIAYFLVVFFRVLWSTWHYRRTVLNKPGRAVRHIYP